MTIEVLPVLGDAPCHTAQNVGSQMLHLDPRKNQKARVVGQEANIAPPRFCTPADVAVARTQVSRRARPRQAGKRSRLPPDQILQMLAYRLLITQIMMLLQQAIKEGLISSAPHLLKLHCAQLTQLAFDGCGI